MAAFVAGARDWIARKDAFSAGRRIRLYHKLSQFTNDGMPIAKALQALHRRMARDKDIKAPLFGSFIQRIQEGEFLSSVWSRHISVGERLLLQSGEESGKMSEGLAAASQLATIMRRLRGALVAELMYPAMLFLMLCVVYGVVAWKLVPVLLDAVPLVKWPTYSMGLYYISNFILNWGIYLLVGLAALLYLAVRTLPTWRGPTREFLDKYMPPWSIYRETTGASFLIALSALVTAGMSVRVAVQRLAISASPWLKVHTSRMLESLFRGTNPGHALRTGLFVREVEDDIEDYGGNSGFERALGRVGVEQVDEVIERVTARARVLRTLLMILVAASLLYVWSATIYVAMSLVQSSMGGGLGMPPR